MARVCVITAGHLSTCPRMSKAADALAGAGHDVRVVSTRQTAWAVHADADMRGTRSWRWRVVDYGRDTAPFLYVRSGLRGRLAMAAASRCGPRHLPYRVAVHAYARVHSELVAAAIEEPADLFYGGTTGALAATAEAANRTGTPYGLDLEDFHSVEQQGARGQLMNELAARIESRVLPGAAFLTTSSDAMADAYVRQYGVNVVTVVNNTFPLPADPPDFTRAAGEPLRAYWFSQTIGPGRGLEGFIRGAAAAGVPIALQLRGQSLPGYVETLIALASSTAPRMTIQIEEPQAPDRMIELCRAHDIGLAVEDADVLSKRLSLSNKALTYILAGLAVVLTETPGHAPLVRDLGEGALLYRQGDDQRLGEGLRRWYHEPARLLGARQSSWSAAVRHWHWEHATQRGMLISTVRSALA